MAKKPRRIKVKRQSYKSLDKMDQDELRREIDGLPRRIEVAIIFRDKLFGGLRDQWSTAYANDAEFITAYARAEAAGQEVVALYDRAVKASRLYNERYSGKLL